ncbi:hypothetical protein ASG47_19325 [Devosia sp. Leaf420]|uniref:DUF1345 domain-containing protein n=1 Tax=Devosia sp. Leaf420 TaxID=1736374 RepID=UPI0007124F5F|nr:DUF1345 domain-containing protein [Devosia sp. Leaf420]KQT51093.1 hypothetical protein ASG47_19325 [Devosia sp. Leaf420]
MEYKGLRGAALARVMPRHAPFYFGLAIGAIGLAISLLFFPEYAVSVGANCFFAAYLVLTLIKLPHLTATYLQKHARDEDTPGFGLLLIVLIVIIASVVSLFLALNQDGGPEAAEIVASVGSVVLGWFTVQVMGALHYAYEYYQAPDTENGSDIEGGLQFPGDEKPDGIAFLYFSFTVGTSVATSDTKVTTNEMRKRVMTHLVFAHFYNTVLLAAAVNVMLGSGGG